MRPLTPPGVTKVQIGKQFGVKPPSVHNWIVKGAIERNNLLALIQFFAGTVGPSHWGLPEIDGLDTRLTLLINELTDDLQTGRLDENDIQMLSNLALRI